MEGICHFGHTHSVPEVNFSLTSGPEVLITIVWLAGVCSESRGAFEASQT